jgi:hypothetical protein
MYVNEINDCKMWSVNCIYYDLKSSIFNEDDDLFLSEEVMRKLGFLRKLFLRVHT